MDTAKPIILSFIILISLVVLGRIVPLTNDRGNLYSISGKFVGEGTVTTSTSTTTTIAKCYCYYLSSYCAYVRIDHCHNSGGTCVASCPSSTSTTIWTSSAFTTSIWTTSSIPSCSYSFALSPSSDNWVGNYHSWSLLANEGSSWCGSTLAYKVTRILTSGSCSNDGTSVSPSSFTVLTNASTPNVLNVNVLPLSGPCTLYFSIQYPDGTIPLQYSFTVSPPTSSSSISSSSTSATTAVTTTSSSTTTISTSTTPSCINFGNSCFDNSQCCSGFCNLITDQCDNPPSTSTTSIPTSTTMTVDNTSSLTTSSIPPQSNSSIQTTIPQTTSTINTSPQTSTSVIISTTTTPQATVPLQFPIIDNTFSGSANNNIQVLYFYNPPNPIAPDILAGINSARQFWSQNVNWSDYSFANPSQKRAFDVYNIYSLPVAMVICFNQPIRVSRSPTFQYDLNNVITNCYNVCKGGICSKTTQAASALNNIITSNGNNSQSQEVLNQISQFTSANDVITVNQENFTSASIQGLNDQQKVIDTLAQKKTVTIISGTKQDNVGGLAIERHSIVVLDDTGKVVTVQQDPIYVSVIKSIFSFWTKLFNMKSK